MASDSTKHRVNLILGNMFRTSGKPLTREEFVTSSSPGDGYGTESPTKGSPVFSHSGGDGEKRGKKTHSRLKAGKTNFYGAFPFMNKRKRLKEEVCEEDEETRKHSTRSMFISPKSLLVVLAWLNFCAGKFNHLHYRTIHYITLHHITSHYITLHYITLHYITLHYITVHYCTLLYITLHLYSTCSQRFAIASFR